MATKKRNSITYKNVCYRPGDEIYVYLTTKYRGIAIVEDMRVTGNLECPTVYYDITFHKHPGQPCFHDVRQEDTGLNEEDKREFCERNNINYDEYQMVSRVQDQIELLENPSHRSHKIEHRYTVGDEVFYYCPLEKKVVKGKINTVTLNQYANGVIRSYKVINDKNRKGEVVYEDDLYSSIEELTNAMLKDVIQDD